MAKYFAAYLSCVYGLCRVSVRHHTRHKPYTQLRYAATYFAINAFTFIRILSNYYILLYDLVSILNFKAT